MSPLNYGLTPKMRPLAPKRAALVVALDVGTSKIACLIARLKPHTPTDVLRRRSHTVEVVGFGHTLARGIKSGAVVDLSDAEQVLLLSRMSTDEVEVLRLLVRRANGTVEEIGAEIAGFPLGIMDDSEYQQTEIQLNHGDVAVIHSDGVTASLNVREEIYDDRRLRKVLAESPGSPEAVGRSILEDIRQFSAGRGQANDITLICFGPTPK